MTKTAPAPIGRSSLFRQFVAGHNPDSRLTNRWWVHDYSPLLSTQILDRQLVQRYSRLDRSPGYLQLILRLNRKPRLPELEPEAEPDSIVERSRPPIKNYERVPE